MLLGCIEVSPDSSIGYSGNAWIVAFKCIANGTANLTLTTDDQPSGVLANATGDLFSADWRGGVAQVRADGTQALYAGTLPGGRPLRPNGIAMRRDGSFLLADLGETLGGIFALARDGTVRPFLEQVDGVDSYRVEATLDSGDLTLLPGNPAPGRDVPTVAWIGVDDQLVRRVELIGPVASGESDDLVRRLILSRFDEDISIVPPD